MFCQHVLLEVGHELPLVLLKDYLGKQLASADSFKDVSDAELLIKLVFSLLIECPLQFLSGASETAGKDHLAESEDELGSSQDFRGQSLELHLLPDVPIFLLWGVFLQDELKRNLFVLKVFTNGL